MKHADMLVALVAGVLVVCTVLATCSIVHDEAQRRAHPLWSEMK